MPKTLKDNIKKVAAIPIQKITATLNGSAIDTKLSEMYSFDTALVDINIGDLGDQTSTTVKVEEADVLDFSAGVQVTEGGDEITIAADTQYKMEIARAKRYLRAVITITGGVSPSAEVCIGMILCNWAKPFPIL